MKNTRVPAAFVWRPMKMTTTLYRYTPYVVQSTSESCWYSSRIDRPRVGLAHTRRDQYIHTPYKLTKLVFVPHKNTTFFRDQTIELAQSRCSGLVPVAIRLQNCQLRQLITHSRADRGFSIWGKSEHTLYTSLFTIVFIHILFLCWWLTTEYPPSIVVRVEVICIPYERLDFYYVGSHTTCTSRTRHRYTSRTWFWPWRYIARWRSFCVHCT